MRGGLMDWKPQKTFSAEEVESFMTKRGGFSKAGLASLGVPWPPPKGWRKAITRRGTKVTNPQPKAKRANTAEAWPEFAFAKFWFKTVR
jgi:hypothetical protein